ncbi:serine/threonine protein kinase [Actinocorallia sp. A-T 12471]|uniref:serine/threonine protein kinase n=1 Tax=Actinocorallia sp. A-T 12471 TaxID=3089813 RepID=UPI0029CECA63|nr:protein kinase [Actinocorallia sp. A-T 12471]MDX6743637.1 protein kinase [Actinocorallia sp. A-T 12471]
MDQPLPGGAKPLGPQDPRTIGAHTVLGKLGQGGMGAVYLGRGPRGTVAIKVIRDELGADPGFRQRFAQEVAAGQRVASFCTAAMLDHGVDDVGHPYLVTEFIEGPTLHDHVLRHGALTEGTLQGFAVGVAAALTAIHGAGLVHRDLKPSNVILSVSGPRVIDFGIARALDATTGVTRTGQLIGTPGWIAPEQLLADQATTAVDVYTWGCLVAFAAQARHPFGGGAPIAMASRVLHGEPDLAGVPEPLLGHVRAAMAKDPSARPTAQQLMLALVGGNAAQSVDAAATALVEESVHGGWAPAPAQPGNPATPQPFPGSGGTPQPFPAEAANPQPYPGQSGTPQPFPGSGGTPQPFPGSGGTPQPFPGSGGTPQGFQQPSADPVTPPPFPGAGQAFAAAHGVPATQQPFPGAPTAPGGHGAHDFPGYGHAPPPSPPPGPTAPGLRRAFEGHRRKWTATGGGVLAVAVAGAALLYGLSQRDDDSGDSAAGNQMERDGYVALPLSDDTGVGQTRQDGGLELSVGTPRCGGKEFEGLKPEKGEFCLIQLTVYNPALTGRPVRVPRVRQVAVDKDGTEIRNREFAGGFINSNPGLPPGGRISGMLLFDVPVATELKSIKVYGSNDSQGVEVVV